MDTPTPLESFTPSGFTILNKTYWDYRPAPALIWALAELEAEKEGALDL